jgi:hypothetical protein
MIYTLHPLVTRCGQETSQVARSALCSRPLVEEEVTLGHIMLYDVLLSVMPGVERLRTGACRVIVVVFNRGITGLETGRGIW